MRTKTLLIAAAALAAGVISSQAQVYSQNIVGYVNSTFPGNNALTMIANPLVGNGTNGATQVLTGLVGGENLFLWSGHGFYQYSFEGVGAGTSMGFPSDWIDLNGGTVAAVPGDVFDAPDAVYWTQPPQLVPGQGGFIQNGNVAAETNTFVGTATLQTTNSPVVLPGNNALALVASVVPIGGNIQNTNFNLPFAGGENVFIWNGHGYYQYSYEGLGAGTSMGFPSDYIDLNGGTVAAVPGDVFDAPDAVYWTQPPSVNVGQGFFVQNGNVAAENWTQNLNVQ